MVGWSDFYSIRVMMVHHQTDETIVGCHSLRALLSTKEGSTSPLLGGTLTQFESNKYLAGPYVHHSLPTPTGAVKNASRRRLTFGVGVERRYHPKAENAGSTIGGSDEQPPSLYEPHPCDGPRFMEMNRLQHPRFWVAGRLVKPLSMSS